MIILAAGKKAPLFYKAKKGNVRDRERIDQETSRNDGHSLDLGSTIHSNTIQIIDLLLELKSSFIFLTILFAYNFIKLINVIYIYIYYVYYI